MLYPEGLMHRKVNIGLALLVIFAVAGIFAWIISARAISGPSFGGLVVKVTPCVLDTPMPYPTTCAVSCPLCTVLLGTACAANMEVIFTPYGGSYNFICPVKGYPFKRGGIPTPGSFILGEGMQVAPLQSW